MCSRPSSAMPIGGFLWEVPDARLNAVAEGEMGHVLLSKSRREEPGEVGQLVALRGQPRDAGTA